MNERLSHSGIIILVLFLIAIAGGLWWWRGSNQKDQHDTYGAQYYEDLAQRYAEDTFGGATPEETLELFIAALEAGNIDLASKYFVAEKQEEWKKNLEKIKAEQVLSNMINDLKNAKRGKNQSDESEDIDFSIANQNNEVSAILRIVKIPNGTWKIQSL
jgi:hypothetical protein